MTDAYTWKGRDVYGSDGEKIGSIKEIYDDGQTRRPEWALVSSGLFGMRSHLVWGNVVSPKAATRSRGSASASACALRRS